MVGRKIKIILLSGVLVLCLLLMIFFGANIAIESHEINKANELYSNVSVQFIPRSSHLAEREFIQASEPVEFTPFVNFGEMRNDFPDLVAWIQSEGTPINYPVVQGEDNYFYLNHLPNKTRNWMGSIFLDSRNSPDFSDRNIIIYGHNTSSGDMFGSLNWYMRPGFFERHPTMFLFTPDNNFEIILIAGYILDATEEVPPINFANEHEFNGFNKNVISRSIFGNNIAVEYGQRLVFLCTCTNSSDRNERLIIVGILAEI
ncbi:MAG: class B sortase [Clostridiales bacterium]|nr:class B sortase [Clostridiales bacterium]